MKNIYLVFLLLSLFFASNLPAQQRNIKKLSKHKRHKIAHDLIKRGSYYNATDQLQELVKTYPEEKEFLFRLGQSYFSSRDYKNAEIWLQKVIAIDSNDIGLPNFYYAEALKYTAKYKEAQKAYSKFYNSKFKEAKNDKYKAFAKNEIASCEYAFKEQNFPAYNSIIHLGDNINSGYTDFSPYKKGDTLYYASLQEDSVIYHHHTDAHFKHVKLFTSENKNGEWSMPSEVKNLNSKFENTANGVYSPDKLKFYYTSCRTDNKHKMNCQILVSKVENGAIGDGKKLEGLINAEGMTFTQPFPFTIGKGKSAMEALMFVSDMPGGKGGMDIWYTTPDKNGSWKKPTNITGINTIRDEITPYYDQANGALYFSSNYHHGFGGFDIFRSTGSLSKWSKPENLGLPVNSRVDDTYFSINGSKESGFLVSNRPGGTHLLSETCCDDIYSHQYQPISLVAVRVFNKKAKARMDGADIKMLTQKEGNLKNLTEAEANNFKDILFDSVSARNNKNPMSISTAEVQYFYKVDKQKDYLLSVKVPNADSLNVLINTNNEGKFTLTKNLSDTIAKIETKHSNQVEVLFVDLYLNPGSTTHNIVAAPKVKLADVSEYTITRVFKDGKLKDKTAAIDLKVILNFELGDTEFLEGKEDVLDSLTSLLKEYPELYIEIAAHTDNVGSHDFNMDLSKRRSVTIENYLAQKGVSKNRMKSKGLGETEPLSPNENPDGSDNPDARAINRRAEIEIMRNISKTPTERTTPKKGAKGKKK